MKIYDLLSLDLYLGDGNDLYFIKEDEFGSEEEIRNEIAKGGGNANEDGTFYLHSKEYFYEEHQCPTNIMRSFEEIYVKDSQGLDMDRHGLLNYMATAITNDEEPDFAKIFNLAQ